MLRVPKKNYVDHSDWVRTIQKNLVTLGKKPYKLSKVLQYNILTNLLFLRILLSYYTSVICICKFSIAKFV